MSDKYKEWLIDYCDKNVTHPDRREVFEAGAKSRQAEIDELQIKYDAMYQAFTVADECRKEWHRCYIGVRNREDELQKQIDEAVEVFEAHDLSHIDQIEKVYGILKGNQNEN